VEQRGAKSGRLTEGPQPLRYATVYRVYKKKRNLGIS
jgi:hypothetical protein